MPTELFDRSAAAAENGTCPADTHSKPAAAANQAQQNAADQAQQNPAAQGGTECAAVDPTAPPAAPPATLLVIDDDASVLSLFKKVFRDSPVDVLTASSAAEGLELVAQRRPDVVLLDIVLPDHSGLELFERIAAIDAKLPVIFITASGTSDTAIEAMKLGAYDYLVKPLERGQDSRSRSRGPAKFAASCTCRSAWPSAPANTMQRRAGRPLRRHAGSLQGRSAASLRKT